MNVKRGLGTGLNATTDTRVTVDDAPKDGRIPIKQKNINLEEWSPIGNALKLPLKLIKFGQEQGIEFHWLSSKQIAENQGVHVRGWKVFRVTDHKEIGLYDYDLGKQADGTVRRGSMVLGYKPKEAADDHRKVLKQKASHFGKYESTKAQELRNVSKSANVSAKIYEGYDENS